MADSGSVDVIHHSKAGVEDFVHDAAPKKEHVNDYSGAYITKRGLDRYITFIPTIAFGATLQASWESVAVSFQAGLYNGGPISLVYGTMLSWIGSLAIAASIGEMASVNPTVGAQYRWTGLYAPRTAISPAFWSLMQGWITVFAWMATCTQPAFLMGTTIQGLIILNHDDYVPQRWHGTLLTWACLAIPLLCNIFARRALAPLEIIGGVAHIVFLVVIVVVLVVLAPRSSASFVFTTSVSGLSGWNNPGVSWCIGLLSATFPLGAFDGVLHMSDEVKNPQTRIPQSMIYAIVINGSMALAFMIVVLFTLGDLQTVLYTKTGYPIIEMFYQATRSKVGATVLMSMLIFNGLVSLFSCLASVSRLTWAFARDRGLPFSNFFGYVHPKLRVPLNSLWLVTIVMVLLSLINIGSTTAFYGIISLSLLALYLSYVIPIVFIVLRKLSGQRIVYGPWNLGRWGLVINLFAIFYGIFIIVFLPFPPTLPTTVGNLNWSGPVLGFVILFALADWFVSGRKRFRVPMDKT